MSLITNIATVLIRLLTGLLMSILVIFTMGHGPVMAQMAASNHEYYRVEPSSKIWVEGSTTVNNFSCVDQQVGGYGAIPEDTLSSKSLTDSSGTQVIVRLNVHDLDCGKRQMNRDMYRAMKADSFPRITYELLSARMLSLPQSPDQNFKAETRGTISLAGKSQVIRMGVEGVMLSDGRFHVTGSHSLLMSDFDIQPPSPFFGLVKTRDRIVVHFDLYVRPSNSIQN